MIALRNVTKSYGDVTPLNGISLEVQRRDFISVVGPSGCGKTTLLNVVAGLLTPTGGEVIVEGTSLYGGSHSDRIAFRRRHFGFVFQTFNLIPYLTVLENVEVPLYLCGMRHGEQRARAEELLERVALTKMRDRLPSTLSAGEQQRVAVVRALANKPRLILADEPTGNLDRQNAKEVVSCLRTLSEGDVTILLVTHDSEIASLADRQVRLLDGRLIA